MERERKGPRNIQGRARKKKLTKEEKKSSEKYRSENQDAVLMEVKQ